MLKKTCKENIWSRNQKESMYNIQTVQQYKHNKSKHLAVKNLKIAKEETFKMPVSKQLINKCRNKDFKNVKIIT